MNTTETIEKLKQLEEEFSSFRKESVYYGLYEVISSALALLQNKEKDTEESFRFVSPDEDLHSGDIAICKYFTLKSPQRIPLFKDFQFLRPIQGSAIAAQQEAESV